MIRLSRLPSHPLPTADRRPPTIAVITGAGSGIGRGIALALARRGHAVALVGRRGEALEETRARCAALGVRAVALPADLADEAARAALPGLVRAALGQPGLLVHAAGILAGGELGDLAEGTIERAVATNLTAPLALTRAFLPDLVAARGGVIVIASLMAEVPSPPPVSTARRRPGWRRARRRSVMRCGHRVGTS